MLKSNQRNASNDGLERIRDVMGRAIGRLCEAQDPRVRRLAGRAAGKLMRSALRHDEPARDPGTCDMVRSHVEVLTRVVCVCVPRTLPERATSLTFVNGRGQVLESQGHAVPDPSDAISAVLYAPCHSDVMNDLICALKNEPQLVKRVRQCVNDGGVGYIQQMDLDAAAIKSYLLKPFLEEYILTVHPRRAFDNAVFSAVYDRVFGALRGAKTIRRVMTPVLGIEMPSDLQLEPGVVVRRTSDLDRERWNRAGTLERSIARDLFLAECVVEVSHFCEWDTSTIGEVTPASPWDPDQTYEALMATDRVVAAMRIVSGHTLPLVFSETQIVDLPWVYGRMPRRPTEDDTTRRFQDSPLWNDVVASVELTADVATQIESLWRAMVRVAKDDAVLRALWLFNDERNYINLYKVYEVVEADVGGNMIRLRWATNTETKRFSHTANSPMAIGYKRARHGKEHNQPPAQPMDLAVADELMRRILRQWILHKAPSVHAAANAPSSGA